MGPLDHESVSVLTAHAWSSDPVVLFYSTKLMLRINLNRLELHHVVLGGDLWND